MALPPHPSPRRSDPGPVRRLRVYRHRGPPGGVLVHRYRARARLRGDCPSADHRRCTAVQRRSRSMKIKMKQQDLLWALAVKDRDAYTCQRCWSVFPEGRRQGLHAHHSVASRGHRATRWMLANGVSLCMGCHMWAHRNPLEAHELWRDRLGEVYDEIRLLSNQTKVSA